jgi:hypothetical protein
MSVPSWEGEQGRIVRAGAGVAVDVVVEVSGEDVECAGGEPGGAVGVSARAASGYHAEAAVEAFERVGGVGVAGHDLGEVGGDRGEPEGAGSALFRGFGGEVAQQVSGLSETTRGVGQRQQDGDPEGGSGRG